MKLEFQPILREMKECVVHSHKWSKPTTTTNDENSFHFFVIFIVMVYAVLSRRNFSYMFVSLQKY